MLVLARVQHDHAFSEAAPDLGLVRHRRGRRGERFGRRRARRALGAEQPAAADHAGGGKQDREPPAVAARRCRHHSAPLCGAVDRKGTPKKVRKASANTAARPTPLHAGDGRSVARACSQDTSASQVRNDQVSSGSQAQ